MSRNAEFYDKLLKRIIFVFCFLFLVFINLLRFYQLQTEENPVESLTIAKPLYLSFVLFQTQDQTRIIFLQDRMHDLYFQTVLKKINNQTYHAISFINCSQNSFSALRKVFENEFPNQPLSEESCDIDLDELQKLYNQNTLIIVVFKNQNFRHQKALNFAYQNKLKPSLKTVEIKNDI